MMHAAGVVGCMERGWFDGRRGGAKLYLRGVLVFMYVWSTEQSNSTPSSFDPAPAQYSQLDKSHAGH